MSARLAVAAAVTLMAIAAAPLGAQRYIFAWAGDGDRKVSDFLSVIDAEPTSKTYGHVLKTLPAGTTGGMPHHTEYEFPASGVLMANAWTAGRGFAFDLRKPLEPKIHSTFTALGPYTYPHSFARLPNGHVLATMQSVGRKYAPPGGLVELDERGNFIRSGAANTAGLVDSIGWVYSLAVDAKRDRVITSVTSMGMPRWFTPPAGSWSKGRVDSQYTRHIQVWSLSQLKPLVTLELPQGPPMKGPKPDGFAAEPRLLADGSFYVNTFQCGLYRVTDVDKPAPKVALVHTFPIKPDDYCAVPAMVGNYWIQPSAAINGLIVLDISKPARPVEVDRLVLDQRFMMPHWLAADTRRSRILVTGDDAGWVLVVNVDAKTGKLSLDKTFKDERTGAVGVSLDNRQYPQGMVKKAFVHGTLFGPR